MTQFNSSRFTAFDNLEYLDAVEKSAVFPFHLHDSYCISLIRSGAERLITPANEYLIPAGCISVTQASEVHRNQALGEQGYAYRTLYVNPEVLRYLNQNEAIAGLERVIYDPQLFELFNNLRENDQPALAAALCRLLVYRTSTALPQVANRFSGIDGLIDDADPYELSIDWLASVFHLSKYHFIRLFHKEKGISPHAYVTIRLLERAKQLILSGMPFREVALATGFSHGSHFAAAFKRYYGVTPTGWK